MRQSINRAFLSIVVALLAVSGPASAQQSTEGQPAPAAPASAPAPAAPDSAPAAAAPAAAGSMKVIIGRDMSYIDPNSIAKAVLTECQLP